MNHHVGEIEVPPEFKASESWELNRWVEMSIFFSPDPSGFPLAWGLFYHLFWYLCLFKLILIEESIF